MEKPTARYFPETNSLVIDIVPDVPAARVDEVAEDILIDYDQDGRVVAIEFPGGVRELLGALLAKSNERSAAKTAKEPPSPYDPREQA